MAEERSGMVRPTGTAEQGTTRVTTQSEAGAVDKAYSKAVDTAAEGAQSVKRAALATHDFLRDFMEENPHTTAVIALGLGLLIGYTARRPERREWWG